MSYRKWRHYVAQWNFCFTHWEDERIYERIWLNLSENQSNYSHFWTLLELVNKELYERKTQRGDHQTVRARSCDILPERPEFVWESVRLLPALIFLQKLSFTVPEPRYELQCRRKSHFCIMIALFVVCLFGNLIIYIVGLEKKSWRFLWHANDVQNELKN